MRDDDCRSAPTAQKGKTWLVSAARATFPKMKLGALYLSFYSYLAFALPLERRGIVGLIRPIESLGPISPVVVNKMHYFDLHGGSPVYVDVTNDFYKNHIAFNGKRIAKNGIFPDHNTVIRETIVWNPPIDLIGGRIKYTSKNPVQVDYFHHTRDGIYEKSGSAVKKLIAHGSRLKRGTLIDHLHGSAS